MLYQEQKENRIKVIEEILKEDITINCLIGMNGKIEDKELKIPRNITRNY